MNKKKLFDDVDNLLSNVVNELEKLDREERRYSFLMLAQLGKAEWQIRYDPEMRKQISDINGAPYTPIYDIDDD